jgi:hypothetical protein
VTSRAEGAEAESPEKEDERAKLEGTGNVRWYMRKTVVDEDRMKRSHASPIARWVVRHRGPTGNLKRISTHVRP